MNRSFRRYDLDWLRVAATLAVFVFHCLRFFDLEAWHVKNNQLDAIASLLVEILLQWIMPLFFLLSGTSIYFALKFRTAGQFLRDRCLRLLAPLVFGVFVLSPPQIYLERLSDPAHSVALWNGGQQFSGSFWEFLPYYFQGWYLFGGNFAWMGVHLWYLLTLFLFSLLVLPLGLALKQGKERQQVERFAIVLAKPGMIFLPGLLIAILESGLDPNGWGMRLAGGWNFFTYFTFLLSGYFIVADQRMEQSIARQFMPAFAIATVTTLCFLEPFRSLLTGNEVSDALVTSLRACNAWCWMVAFLGFAKQFLSFNHPALRYLSEASLPFYILHQPILLIIGFWISEWQLGILPKLMLLSTVAFLTILLLYEHLVRQFGWCRICFGLKPT